MDLLIEFVHAFPVIPAIVFGGVVFVIYCWTSKNLR
jgi:hypothetical protein